VELLLGAGAGLNSADRTGYTAIMKAMVNGHTDIASLLQQKGASLTDANRRTIQQASSQAGQGEEVLDPESK